MHNAQCTMHADARHIHHAHTRHRVPRAHRGNWRHRRGERHALPPADRGSRTEGPGGAGRARYDDRHGQRKDAGARRSRRLARGDPAAADRRVAHRRRVPSGAAAGAEGPAQIRSSRAPGCRDVPLHRAARAGCVERWPARRKRVRRAITLVRALGLPLELLPRHLPLRARSGHPDHRRERPARGGHGRAPEGVREPDARRGRAHPHRHRRGDARPHDVLQGVHERRRQRASRA